MEEMVVWVKGRPEVSFFLVGLLKVLEARNCERGTLRKGYGLEICRGTRSEM